ncbi:MAG: KaiC domain-containing protein [Euryarchaeota archaeon]|nr:KaiC domain-containing protein [Euryarchaeota archaeon]
MRVSTGIEGLDDMIDGGFPEGHSVAVIGSFGTGKTTFAMQFIWEGLQRGEKCIFLSLEEDEDSIVETARTFGWDFESYLDEKLLIIKLEPEDAGTSIKRLEGEIPEMIREFEAKRIAIDSVSLITMMFRTEEDRRKYLFTLSKSIKESGATALYTAEIDPHNPQGSRDGLVEYVVDGVILLTLVEYNNAMRPILRVLKMRRTRHSREVKPYEITEHGLVVMSESAML